MELTSRSFTEKRQSPRFSENNTYTLILNHKHYQGELGNISLGGAYLRTISPLPSTDSVYQDCQLTTRLSENFITISCTIAFVGTGRNEQSAGVGIAFNLEEDQVLTTIADHIKTLQPIAD